MYEERTYRKYMKPEGFVNFTVVEYESDLQVSAKVNLEEESRNYLKKYREDIMSYGKRDKNFYKSLVPVNVPDDAPDIVKHMAKATASVNVGPMASVAGAISQYVGLELLKHTDEVIIENGGDIFISCRDEKKILIYAGSSPFSNKVALSISPEDMPLGVCTSAGTVGHSLSFGVADAVVILSKDTVLSDAAATAVGNIISSPNSINAGLEYAASIEGVLGAVIIVGDKMGAIGKVSLVKP